MPQQRRSHPTRSGTETPEPPDTGTADRAGAWLRGQGDLLTAGMGRPVPAATQLGVLAHADLARLRDLGRYCRRGSVRRSWGTEMARLAGDLAGRAGSPDGLRQIQGQVLVPLELEVLASQNPWTRRDLIARLRAVLEPSCHGMADATRTNPVS
jgi:hypothetical protein